MIIGTETLAAKFKASGLTQETFCKEHGVPIERLRYYLYKKNKVRAVRKRKVQQPAIPPSFLSFNQPVTADLNNNKETPGKFTIIHGNFTVEELVTLISNLE
jgi:hypothetical protein